MTVTKLAIVCYTLFGRHRTAVAKYDNAKDDFRIVGFPVAME